MYSEKELGKLLKDISSVDPVPGGGAVSAMAASMAGALGVMVASLTIEKDGKVELKPLMEKCNKLSQECLKLSDDDSKAYTKVMTAYQMPKNTAEEIKKRTEAIQEALQIATIVPLRTAECALQIVEAALELMEKGRKSAYSDAVVSAVIARAAFEGAFANVDINIAHIKDEKFLNSINLNVKELKEKFNRLSSQIDGKTGQKRVLT